MNNHRRGFALIVSVLALSSILLTVAAASAFELASAERRGVELQRALDAQALAEGCAEAAIMKLRLDNSYVGNETLVIGDSSCTIKPIIAGTPTILETEATVSTSVYRLDIHIDDVVTMKISSWRRVATF